jgi:alpha-L-fucosidase
MLGVGAAAASVPLNSAPQTTSDEDRARRMKWWQEARFGMFIHWGLYSILGRHEWVMENEGIPVSEYQELAKRFTPKPNAARDWAKLAKRAGMKYMVMTTKHHEGFCNFNTKLTNYCAPKQACGRDLVEEFAEAARAEGLRVGFYYSLMDWHHPDGARCATDEDARKRFVQYTHGQVRELCAYKPDILWYDVAWPLDANGWESVAMNKMVRGLLPDIIINNRSKVPEDFDTPENQVEASKGRYWETCMKMNGSWGYQKSNDDWKTLKTIVRYLIACARDGGNYLLNIGPKPDGSIPEESIRVLNGVGKWMDKNGSTIYGSEPCRVSRSNYCGFSRKGNTLFVHIYFWPGDTAVVGGLTPKVLSVKLLVSGKEVKFTQDRFRVRFTGLPATPPDDPVTTLAVKCESEPLQETMGRKEKKREAV